MLKLPIFVIVKELKAGFLKLQFRLLRLEIFLIFLKVMGFLRLFMKVLLI